MGECFSFRSPIECLPLKSTVYSIFQDRNNLLIKFMLIVKNKKNVKRAQPVFVILQLLTPI